MLLKICVYLHSEIMSRKTTKRILLSFIVLVSSAFYSVEAVYGTEIDVNKLQLQLSNASNDTNKVNTLLELTTYYIAKDSRNISKALDYAQQAEKLSESLDFKKGKYFTYTNLAKIYSIKGKLFLPQQLIYENKAKTAKTEYLKVVAKESAERIKRLQDEKAMTEAELAEAKRVADEQARIAAETGQTAIAQGQKIQEINADNLRNKIDLLKKDSLLSAKDTFIYLQSLETLNSANELKIANQEKELKDKELKTQKAQNVLYFVLAGSGGVLSLLMFFMFRSSRQNAKKLSVEKKRSDDLLLNILPSEVANELKAFGKAKAQQFDMVSVMFTDFKGFTQISEKMPPEDLVNEIDFCFAEFDKIVSKHNIEKIKTIGDSYLCVGGLPIANSSNPLDVVQAALEIRDFMIALKKERDKKGELCFEIRIGVNTGPVVAGIVGIKKFAYDIWGDTVNTASRMESSGEVGKVNISGSTYEYVKQDFLCQYRGKIDAKNKGQIDMYFAESLKK